MTWIGLLTALSTAMVRIVDFLLMREARARETVAPPATPTTVSEYQKRKRLQSGGSSNGSSEGK